MTKKLLVPLVLIVIAQTALLADAGKGWEKIATTTVSDKVDHATIFMSSEHNHPYNMIKLAVSKADIRILRIRVTFASMQTTDFTLKDLIKDGGETNEITLPHPGFIPRIDFWYEPASLDGKKPHVTFWGYAQ